MILGRVGTYFTWSRNKQLYLQNKLKAECNAFNACHSLNWGHILQHCSNFHLGLVVFRRRRKNSIIQSAIWSLSSLPKIFFHFLCVVQYFVVVLGSVWKSHLLLRSHYLSTHWRGHHLSSYTSSPPNPVKIFSIRWQPQSLSLCSINSSWHHSPKGWTCICKYLVLLVKRLLLTLGMCVARNAIFFKANLVHK